VETSLVPVVEKIEDGHVCWQSDVYCTVFWGHKGVLLVDFMEKSTTINAVSNCATLEML
jgi:hypothetical protein